jgi:hypothetical protein
MRVSTAIAIVASAFAFGACETSRHTSDTSGNARGADSVRAESLTRARQDSVNRAQPAYVVDSALAPGEELRRFRDAIGGVPATAFTGGSDSREALARRLVRSVERRDTADLSTMALSAREFADLVYPTSRLAQRPYRQGPGLMWAQIMRPSIVGFGRLMRERGGTRYAYQGVLCRATPTVEGSNRVWTGCALWLVGPSRDTVTEAWFDSIIERDGRFKIVSFSNRL